MTETNIDADSEMAERWFVDEAGKFLGTFIGTVPPSGSLEVGTPPQDGRQIWTGEQWGEAPAPLTILYPVELWGRMTEEEAETAEAFIASQPARFRNIFQSASSYRSDHELWPLLQGMATELFGEQRAAAILAPSTV